MTHTHTSRRGDGDRGARRVGGGTRGLARGVQPFDGDVVGWHRRREGGSANPEVEDYESEGGAS